MSRTDPDRSPAPRAKRSRVQQLRAQLERASDLYYNRGTSDISDAEYDERLNELAALEAAHPELVTPDSPTQRVGAPAPAGTTFPKVAHVSPMISIDSLTSEDEVREFEARTRKFLGLADDGGLSWAVEPKLDGVSANLLYEDGVLVRGLSRGDGTVGEDITRNLRTIRTIPLRLGGGKAPRRVEIRGEVILSREAFARLQEASETTTDTPFRNARNTVAGTLKLLDPRTVSARSLEFICFGVGHTEGLDAATHTAVRAFLAAAGLKLAEPFAVVDSIDEVIAYHAELEARRESFRYEVDGIVAKVDQIELQRKLGRTARAPRWALAFKFAPRRATTRVAAIVAQVGRTGAITPVAELEPVELAGVTVRRATLHNWGLLAARDVRVDDVVEIERAGDVIPAVVSVDVAKRDARSQPFAAPTECPTCGTQVESEGAFLYCVNLECPDQLRRRVVHFASRRALEIRRLGEKYVDQLIDAGLIRRLEDVFTLPDKRDAILALERWGEKSFEGLVQELERAKHPKLARFLHALGIRHVGEQTAKDLADEFQSIAKLRTATEEELTHVDGVGPEVAASVLKFFALDQTTEFLNAAEAAGLQLEPPRAAPTDASGGGGGEFAGMTFCFTGGLTQMTRDQARALAEARGARTSSSVTKNVTHVIAGEKAGSKLKTAEKLGLTILSEAEFIAMVNP